MTSLETVKKAISALEDKKGEQIHVIDIHDVSVIADYFIIASGTNKNQVQALADSVQEELEKSGETLRQVEGYASASWILMDFNNVIVHIFSTEDRLFYDLERIWRDGKLIDTEALMKNELH